jgi:hypothetical protein
MTEVERNNTSLPTKQNSTTTAITQLLRDFNKDPLFVRVLTIIGEQDGISLNEIKSLLKQESISNLQYVTNGLVDLKYVKNINNIFYLKSDLKDKLITNDPKAFGSEFQLSCFKSKIFTILNELSFGKGHIVESATFFTSDSLVNEFYNDYLNLIKNFYEKSNSLQPSQKNYLFDSIMAGVNAINKGE